MPKIVDPEQRRREIAEAVLRVVSRDGIAAASVRNVATEAGLSLGSLRHYFATHEQMLRATMQWLTADIERRITAKAQAATSVDDLVDVLTEVMPVDEPRRAEFVVWWEVIRLAHTSSPLRDLSIESHEELRRLCLGVWRAARGRTTEDVSTADEQGARHLHATLDGLSLHLSLYPDHLTADEARAILRVALEPAPEKNLPAGVDPPGAHS